MINTRINITQKLNISGTDINKIEFSEIEDFLEEKGLNVIRSFDILSDGGDHVYVSNGFVLGLLTQTETGEWHHFFKKDEKGNFTAGKFRFY